MKFRRPWVVKEIPMTFSTISIRIAIFVSKDDENSYEILDFKHLKLKNIDINDVTFKNSIPLRGFDLINIYLFLEKHLDLWNQ